MQGKTPGAPNKAEKRILGLLLLAVLSIVVFFLHEVHAFGVDDSYIFFRYAENAAAGHGFVFNVGEPPGEGFTSWIWLLMLSLFKWLGLDIILASKILGVLFHLLGGVFLFLLVKHTLDENGNSQAVLTAGILSAAFLVNYRLLAHGVAGMETSLYIFAIVALTYLTTRALTASSPGGPGRWWLILGGAAFGAFLVRPEGVAAGGISLLALAVRQRKEILKPTPWLYVSASLIVPLALFLAWKTMVFGYPLPHSYYHKLIVIKSEYREAFQQLVLFLKTYWPLAVAAVPSALYAAISQKRHVFLYYLLLFLLMISVYLLFYPAMNYLHRFYIPYLPLLLAMTAPAVYILLEKAASVKNPVPRFIGPLLIFLLLAVSMNTHLDRARFKVKGWSRLVDPAVSRAGLGTVMKELPADVVVANTEMGVIPYYSGLTCIDMAGLTDPHTAHHGISMDYLRKRNVNLILFPRDVQKMHAGQWQTYTHAYGSVFLSEHFQHNFRFIGRRGNYYFYADRSSPVYETLRQWGGKQLKQHRDKKK